MQQALQLVYDNFANNAPIIESLYMEILLFFPIIAIICMVLLGYKFVRKRGSIKISILCILFGMAYLYATYLLAGFLWAFGCGMGGGRNCHPTWEKLNSASDIGTIYSIAIFGGIYILLGLGGITHKLYLYYQNKNNTNHQAD